MTTKQTCAPEGSSSFLLKFKSKGTRVAIDYYQRSYAAEQLVVLASGKARAVLVAGLGASAGAGQSHHEPERNARGRCIDPEQHLLSNIEVEQGLATATATRYLDWQEYRRPESEGRE